MMDLQSYLLYELFMARRREVAFEHESHPRKARPPRFQIMPWAMTVLGNTLLFSGRKLKERYEPMLHPRPQASN